MHFPEGIILRACPMVAPALREQLAGIHDRIPVLSDSADAIESSMANLSPAEASTI